MKQKEKRNPCPPVKSGKPVAKIPYQRVTTQHTVHLFQDPASSNAGIFYQLQEFCNQKTAI
jgi:hypothetical protein